MSGLSKVSRIGNMFERPSHVPEKISLGQSPLGAWDQSYDDGLTKPSGAAELSLPKPRRT